MSTNQKGLITPDDIGTWKLEEDGSFTRVE